MRLLRRTTAALAALCAAVALAAAPGVARAQQAETAATGPAVPTRASAPAVAPRARAARRRHEPPRPASAALGYANAGRLEHAAMLQADEHVRHLPGRVLHYGTDELVGLLRRVGRRLHREHRVRLTVGDLSAAHGGPVGHHASHQNGRDADLAFFVVDARGRSVALGDYASFDGSGAVINGPAGWRFDTARNWALVAALLDDPAVRVEHLFVSNPLRALLLAHGRAIGSRSSLLDRAALAMHQPVNGLPHRNHFHVRIGCPEGDQACIDGVRPRPRPRGRPRVVRNDRARPHGAAIPSRHRAR